MQNHMLAVKHDKISRSYHISMNYDNNLSEYFIKKNFIPDFQLKL